MLFSYVYLPMRDISLCSFIAADIYLPAAADLSMLSEQGICSVLITNASQPVHDKHCSNEAYRHKCRKQQCLYKSQDA